MTASKAVALPLGDRPTVLKYISVACWVVTRLFKSERMVRKERLELSHLTALEPKSSASTNSATSANFYLFEHYQKRMVATTGFEPVTPSL